MKKIRVLSIICLILFVVLTPIGVNSISRPTIVNAQLGDDIGEGLEGLDEGLDEDSDEDGTVTDADILANFVNNVAKFALPLGIGSLVTLFLYAGFLMVTSQGNPEKLKEAREILSNAVVGFILIVLASSILTLIINVFGLLAL